MCLCLSHPVLLLSPLHPSSPTQAAASTAGHWGAALQRTEQEWTDRLEAAEADAQRRIARLREELADAMGRLHADASAARATHAHLLTRVSEADAAAAEAAARERAAVDAQRFASEDAAAARRSVEAARAEAAALVAAEREAAEALRRADAADTAC